MKINVKYIIACLIGNCLEWYDFILYGIFAGVIAQLFFPAHNAQVSLMATFAVLAVGYFTRPLGGILFGHFGDRLSRRGTLVIALLAMGVITTLIGLLPSYASIGILASILMLLLRMLQGIAVGGEFPGAMIFLIESAPKKHQALFSVLVFVGAMMGVLLATFVASFITHFYSVAQVKAFAWRLPFLLGIVLSLVGVYLRLKFLGNDRIAKPLRVPIYDLFSNHFKEFLRAFGYLFFPAVFTGIMVVFLVPYLTHYHHFSLALAIHVESLMTVLTLFGLLAGAFIVDRLRCYTRWLRIGIIIVIVMTYPLFKWMATGESACILGLAILTLLSCVVMAPEIVFVARLFKPSMRYSGIGLAHGLAFSLLSGTAPFVLNYLAYHFGAAGPSAYYIFAAVVALCAVMGRDVNHLD